MRRLGRGLFSIGRGLGALLAAVAALGLTAGCASSRNEPPSHDPEFAARLDSLAEAYSSRDAEKILSFYDPDTYTLSFGQRYKFDTGSQSHKESLARIMGDVGAGKLTMGEETLVWKRDTDKVWTLRPFAITADLKDGGKFTFKGKHSAIWVEKNGAWLISYEHFWGDPEVSRPAPPPPPPAPPIAAAPAQRPALKDVFFDLDKYDIRPDQRATMDENLEILKKWPSVEVLIEGHCDDRASRKYNMKLGQNRANETRDFLVAGGIDPGRIKTVSMGKERPFAEGRDEESRQSNRRSHFVVTKE
ncbi:hypothetical protein FBQ97_07660 [Acidobacteria bacterium ACD]|nr:MAG: hypothetical protein EDX89_19170 [Acidobacteriota bacterium]MCE7959192.1 hypothetical protein [Acidobacteria bacterium ACB2]MDL1949673.1 hypothetical protein [Acidobacteria bacterium ACD]